MYLITLDILFLIVQKKYVFIINVVLIILVVKDIFILENVFHYIYHIMHLHQVN